MKYQFTVQSFYRNFNTLLASLFARCSLPKNIYYTKYTAQNFQNDFQKYTQQRAMILISKWQRDVEWKLEMETKIEL